jgi:hypothetical protein
MIADAKMSSMLGAADLRLLSGWCRRHRMSWLPGCADDGEPGLLLLAHASGHWWEQLLLLTDAPELRLMDRGGAIMATASDLPALLDALEAGMAEA